MKTTEILATVLLVVGGLNWGLVGALDFDLVAALVGDMTAAARAVYVLVGVAAVYRGATLLASRPARVVAHG